MARVDKVETCIFCGDAPCSCNVKAKAEPKPRKPRAPRKAAAPKTLESAPPPEAKPPVSIQDAMVAAAKRKAPPPKEVAAVMDDIEVCMAIKAVEGIMHEDEKVKWKAVLDMEITPQDRAAAWRARRDVVVE
jgi:hypothetical protein